MNRPNLNTLKMSVALIVGIAGIFLSSSAADSAPSNTPQPTTRQDILEQLKNLTPAERDAKLKEIREKYGRVSPERQEMEKRREELKNLSPEEREKKIREWRQAGGADAPPTRSMSSEEREAHRKAIRARLHQELEKLRQGKTNGTLTAEQQKRLERLEEMTKRLEQTGTNVTPRSIPAPPVREKIK